MVTPLLKKQMQDAGRVTRQRNRRRKNSTRPKQPRQYMLAAKFGLVPPDEEDSDSNKQYFKGVSMT